MRRLKYKDPQDRIKKHAPGKPHKWPFVKLKVGEYCYAPYTRVVAVRVAAAYAGKCIGGKFTVMRSKLEPQKLIVLRIS